MRFTASTDRFVVLKGNHEAMMVDALAGDFDALSLWRQFGGDATLASWGIAAKLLHDGPSTELLRTARAVIPGAVLRWLKTLPLTWHIGNYLFVHAGIRPGVPVTEQLEEDLLWIRNEFLATDLVHPAMVVHGHAIRDEVEMRGNRIGIDTGAYRTGILSALGLEGMERWTLATRGAND